MQHFLGYKNIHFMGIFTLFSKLKALLKRRYNRNKVQVINKLKLSKLPASRIVFRPINTYSVKRCRLKMTSVELYLQQNWWQVLCIDFNRTLSYSLTNNHYYVMDILQCDRSHVSKITAWCKITLPQWKYTQSELRSSYH